MRISVNEDVLRIIVGYAWPVPPSFTVTWAALRDQLECALDCQQNIPPWFLNDVQMFPHRRPRTLQNEPPLMPLGHLKKFNPLVLGAAFSLFDPAQIELNRRSLSWLFNALTPQYLRRKKMLRKPLFRFLDAPVLKVWNRLLQKIGDATLEDINPKGYMNTLITTAMVTHLPCASPVGNWARRFSL